MEIIQVYKMLKIYAAPAKKFRLNEEIVSFKRASNRRKIPTAQADRSSVEIDHSPVNKLAKIAAMRL